MEKYYQEFDDSDENKLSYTPIFKEYVSFDRLCLVNVTGQLDILYVIYTVRLKPPPQAWFKMIALN